jgi:multiple sugar transport system permease protein
MKFTFKQKPSGNNSPFTSKPRYFTGLRRLSYSTKDKLYGYLFISPQMLGFLIFIIGPLIAIFIFSLQSRNLLSGEVTFNGIENYRQLFVGDPIFKKVIKNSLIFTAGLVPLNMVLALTLAILLARRIFAINFFRTVFFSPVVTSAVAWAIVWRFILQGDNGSLNQFLQMLGIQGPNWLREPTTAMAAVIVNRVLKNVGLNMVIFLAALQSLPSDQMEASQVDGANTIQTIRYIVLPYLAPTILLVAIITTIGSLKVFDTIMMLTSGGPQNATMVLVYYVYFVAFRTFETGYASALAVILFLIAFVLTVIQWSARKRIVYLEE